MMAEQVQAVDIGKVFELKGYAKVIREKDYNAELDFGIQSYDDVRTSNGRIAISFEDQSTVKLTEHSKLVIDEYIYDPNPSKSKLALNFASGTVRFITGNLTKIDKKNIFIKTPTADISIRGTDFTTTVNEIGESLIILLPNPDGSASGEIEVSTAVGSVILNRPFEATTVSVYETMPSKPVILDLTLDIIDNMLIVSPPEEKTDDDLQGTRQVNGNNLLAFDDLDIDYLAEDFFEDADFEFTELDIDYLNVNFFEDLLDILEEIDELEDEQLDQQATTTAIKGTNVGQDTTTQITTIITGNLISLRRNVNQSVQLDLDSGSAYTVIFIQDGVSNQIIINGGGSSKIRILQSSG
tara:strand:+ start:402 stop:1463 length:1062 start_codon:yes stop_codon:yes gene_type:complete